MKKREYILLRLIEEYIRKPEPISSSRLQENLDIELSSATIRYYFQQLTDAGALEKTHISSGRVPTLPSLREFWKQRLEEDLELELADEPSCHEIADSKRIFCEYYTLRNKTLTELERYRNFLVLVFEDREFVVAYSKSLERFLRAQIGKRAFALARDCYTIGLVGFSKALKEFLQERFELCGLEEVVEISNASRSWAKEHLPRLLDRTMLYEGGNGVQFWSDLLGYKFTIVDKSDRMRGEMLLVGRVYRDFKGFINSLKGVEHG